MTTVVGIAAFVVVAVAATLARVEIGRRTNGLASPWGPLPWGTLAVNVTGAFLLGLLAPVAPPALTVLGTGGLGTFTTFSTLAAETVALAEDRRRGAAAAYLLATAALGIAAAAAGVALSGAW